MVFYNRSFYILLISIFFIKSSFSRTLKVCMEPKEAFPIYQERGKEKGRFPGLYFEMFELLKEKMKVRFKFKRRPFKRCLLALKGGKVDIVASVSFKEDRKKIGVYPMKNDQLQTEQRISESSYYLYSFKRRGKVWDNKSLKSIRGVVGSVQGYSIVKDLKVSKVRVKEINGLKNAFNKLKSGEFKSLAIHESEGDVWLKKRGFKGLIKSKVPLKRKNYYLLISHKLYRNDRSFSHSLWKTVEKLRVSDRYKKIKSKYLEKGKW